MPITSQLQGIDSLLSTVQMPSGVPVATVGVNAAKNAGLLAVEILALSDRVLKDRLKAYRSELVKEVERKNQAIQASRSERSE